MKKNSVFYYYYSIIIIIFIIIIIHGVCMVLQETMTMSAAITNLYHGMRTMRTQYRDNLFSMSRRTPNGNTRRHRPLLLP